MDPTRFDMLARSLTARPSRRWLLGIIPAGLFASLPLALVGLLNQFGLADVAAKRKKKKKKRRKKPRAAPPPEPTCGDGIQNGDETGVDCGGSCDGCASGESCATRNDCASAFCHESGTCQFCSQLSDCGGDDNGHCICGAPIDDPTNKTCLKRSSTASGDSQTCVCPTGTFCVNDETQPGRPPRLLCHKLCGGGCGEGLANCESDAHCCDTSCTPDPRFHQLLCMSPPGGRCRQDWHCASCHVESNAGCNSDCDVAAGVCRCPEAYECCSNSDCGSAERCQTDVSGLNGECVPRDIG